MQSHREMVRGLAVAWALGTLLPIACGGSDDRALVIVQVRVAAEIPDFKNLTISVPSDSSEPSRTLDGPSHRSAFQLGYYVSHPSGTITLRAQALRAGGCVLGEGSVSVSGLAARKEVQGGTLQVSKLENPDCDNDGGIDASDVSTDGPADQSPPSADGSKLLNGQSCANSDDCLFGHCVDGVCCDSECTGQCSSCNEPNGGAGKCLIISGSPRGPRPACGGTAPCAARCDGTDGMACKYPGNDVSCVAASCANGSVSTATVCNGAGGCTAAMTSMCQTKQCADATKCAGGCSAASPCGVGKYCDPTGLCLAVKANGADCQTGVECASAFCVDGVCCSSSCDGQCQACHEPNSAGTCVTVSGAPRGSRKACAGTQAACAGRCGGTSATDCAFPDGKVVCTPAACSSTFTMTPPSVCNGSGSCTTVTATMCTSGSYCSGTACVPQGTTGAACQTNPQCQSGNCSSGLCCAAGQTNCGGVCKNLAADSANCGNCGHGCPGSICANGSLTPASTCNGSGACTSPAPSACPSNQCADNTKCSGGCSATLPCGGGKYCDPTGVCLPLKPNGTPCQNSSECANSACFDGVCCSSACTSQCQACNEPNNVGTCITVSGAPRGSRPACNGSQATCAGHCDGTNAAACTYPSGSAVCSPATCSGSFSFTPASVCNGSGACAAAASTNCGGGNYCTGGACMAQEGNGQSCSNSPQCQSGNCSNSTCCAGGQTGCSGACKNLSTDATNCGACGKVCSNPGDPNGKVVCQTGQCGFACNKNFEQCGSMSVCQRDDWDFEDGTDQGFTNWTELLAWNPTNQAAHTGTWAFSAQIRFQFDGSFMGVRVNLACSLPVKGRTISGWVRLVGGPLGTGTICYLAQATDPLANEGGGTPVQPAQGQWTNLQVVPDGPTVGVIYAKCEIYGGTVGAIYEMDVDDVALQ